MSAPPYAFDADSMTPLDEFYATPTLHDEDRRVPVYRTPAEFAAA